MAHRVVVQATDTKSTVLIPSGGVMGMGMECRTFFIETQSQSDPVACLADMTIPNSLFATLYAKGTVWNGKMGIQVSVFILHWANTPLSTGGALAVNFDQPSA